MMKKFLIGSLFLVFLSSCSVSETFRDDPEFTAMKGILTAQKTGDEYSGTHLITDESATVTAIRSLSINLDSSKYLNNEIEALGVLNPKDSVFEVTGISVIKVLAPNVSDAELTLYRNADFGFEMSYYSDWLVDEDGSTVTFELDSEDGSISSEIVLKQIPYAYYPVVNEDGSSDTPLSAYFLSTTGEDVSQMINKVGPDTLDAVKKEGTGDSITYTLYRSGLIYELSYLPKEGEDAVRVKNVFMEMISTFRFIGFEVDSVADDSSETDESPTADTNLTSTFDLTKFESLPYHFSGKYPEDWYYAGERGASSDVKHHYGFSDESVTKDNELISLEVLSNADFSGKKDVVSGRELYVKSGQDTYTIYLTLEGQNYKLTGLAEYKDLILTMALAIEPIKEPGAE